MRLAIAALALCATLSAGGRRIFSEAEGTLTPGDARPKRAIALDFLQSTAAKALDLGPADFAGTYVHKEFQTAHNGVAHFVYRQRFQGLEVYNAEFVINVDSAGRVLNAGGSLYNRPTAPLPASPAAKMRGAARAAARNEGSAAAQGELVWYGVNGALRAAWAFTVEESDGIERNAAVIDYETERLLDSSPLTHYQNPRGLVFERSSPRPHPAPGTVLREPPPIVERTMQSFMGDPVASPRGWVSGNTTSGNNAHVGVNRDGIRFWPSPVSPVAMGGNFAFPLEFGPNLHQFGDAAATNLFYWINRAHDLFHQAGFDEPAGSFQNDNFGRGGIEGDAIYAYSQFGAGSPQFAQLNNAFYSNFRRDDGSPAMIAMFLGTYPGGYTDGSFDAHVMVHEYTHGVSSRLVRRGYDTHQGRAMGESWSDFFSLEFTIPEGTPPDGIYTRAEYLYSVYGTGSRSYPFSTDMSANPLTYVNLGRVLSFPQVHADGEIWTAALWDMRANLIRQFGEREGRRRVRILVIDGMKLSTPAPSMADMRDAILLADRVGFRGESQEQIWRAFAKRGLGVLTQSASGDSVHVAASFEVPSNRGAIGFYEERTIQGQPLRVVLHDGNQSAPSVNVELSSGSGDRERLLLYREGGVYRGTLPTSAFSSDLRDGRLSLSAGDSITASYTDPDTGAGPSEITRSVPTMLPNSPFSTNATPLRFDGERLLFRSTFGDYRTVSLPFGFTFFGERHGSVRVWSDGLLSFGTSTPTLCYDANELGKVKGVAPLWLPMQTNGFLQQGEGVFVSETPDSITFRWAGETPLAYFNPQPVNFAATLYSDGRIEFRYGSGNKNMTTGVNFMCGHPAPTVGLSAGQETYIERVNGHHGVSDLENARTITFYPPAGDAASPTVRLDAPVEGAQTGNVLQVRGAIWDHAESLVRADVMIDGRYRARANVVFAPRPRICTEQSIVNCAGLEFDADVAALGLAPGSHSLQVRAVNRRGAFANYPETPVSFNVTGSKDIPVHGAIDAPAANADVSGVIRVTGWVGIPGLRVNAVDVMIDGITMGRATHGLPTPDACAALTPSPSNCPNLGFFYTLNTAGANPPVPNGVRALQLRVTDSSGRVTLLPDSPVPINVSNPVNERPISVLVTPSHNERVSGVTRIWGYGWDPDGRVLGATLIIDGESRGNVPYGEPRPGECANLPEVRACPNIGFALEFDTRLLSNGVHQLGVLLFDDRGGSAYARDSPSVRGITIVVDNQ